MQPNKSYSSSSDSSAIQPFDQTRNSTEAEEPINDTIARLHSFFVHFPIALLLGSIFMDFAARLWPRLGEAAWPTLLFGTLALVPATVSGIVAHFPYEGSSVMPLIEQHQLLGFASTALFAGLAIWRGIEISRGSNPSGSWLYMTLCLVGVVLLLMTGRAAAWSSITASESA